ncbi:MAG: hypothetical protein KY475_10805 [Planctomycetes bacterium]|nr:hypothetical protein [Planctomycetota bacterium]
MALRLSDLVVCGEIFNTSWYSVHGWLALRGGEQMVHLQLTGNCAADLAGWHFRFESRDAEAKRPGLTPDDMKGFAWQQVGPTGEMTIKDISPPPPSERSPAVAGKQPPQKCLHLEWFSQNGRILVELIDPKIELLEYNDLEANPAGPPRQRADTDDELFDAEFAEFEPESDALDAAMLDEDDGGLPWEDDDEADVSSWLEDDDDDEEEDPYGLLPEALKQHFDDAACETDQSLNLEDLPDAPPWLAADDEDKPEVVRELELMDDCIERGDGEFLSDLFDGPLQLPRPEQLGSDEAAEHALKTLLATLARCGVSLAVCHHFTPRDAYRLLIDEICVGQRAYRELQGTQWVQTFMTSEYCPQCDEEFEREYQEYERRRKERGDEPDDDIPF